MNTEDIKLILSGFFHSLFAFAFASVGIFTWWLAFELGVGEVLHPVTFIIFVFGSVFGVCGIIGVVELIKRIHRGE